MPAVVQVKFVVSDAEGLAKLSNWKNQVQALGGAGSSGPLTVASKGFADFGREAERSGGFTNFFRESVHALHPVIQSAGVEMGVLGGLARASGVGLKGFAAAALGAAAVALAKLADEAGKTENHITGVTGGAAIGAKTFEQLQSRAKSLGVEVGDLGDVFTSLYAAQKKNNTILIRAVPGQEDKLPAFANPSRTADAASALREAIGAGAASRDEARTASAGLGASISEAGALTLKGFQGLEKESPGGAASLAKLLGQTDVSGFEAQLKTAAISTETLIARLQQIGPAAEKAFQQGAGSGALFSDALGSLVTRSKDAVEKLAGKPTQQILKDEATKAGGDIEGFLGDVGKIKTQVQTGEFQNPLSVQKGDRSIFGGYELHIDPNAAIGDFINAVKAGAAAVHAVTGGVGATVGRTLDRGANLSLGDISHAVRGGPSEPLPWVQKMLDAAQPGARAQPQQPAQPQLLEQPQQQSSSGGDVHVVLNIDGKQVADAVIAQIGQSIRRSTGQKTSAFN